MVDFQLPHTFRKRFRGSFPGNAFGCLKVAQSNTEVISAPPALYVKLIPNAYENFTHNITDNLISFLKYVEGSIWIGTRVAEKDNADANKRFGQGGINKYNSEKFIHFPEINGFNEIS
jgi:hypothetical protein